MLIVRKTPEYGINSYFALEYKYYPEDRPLDVPDNLKAIVLKPECYINYKSEFDSIYGINIYVDGLKADCPWDRIAPGWNCGNLVTYGDKWYMSTFYDAEGELISMECFKNSQAIRPPYVVLPKSGDTAYTHVGWDINGDGEPDGLPASRLSDVVAHAVVTTSTPAYYTVKFIDMDRKTVIEQYELEYGETITLPSSVPEKRGYTFTGWENYEKGMTVDADTRIYSVWKHDGEGHEYVETVIPPMCTEKGYTLHKCSICDDEYRTDYVDETWHTFGDWIIDNDSTCSEYGARHRVCEICGFTENAIVEKKSHKYDRTVLKEASCTEQGVVSCICSECGSKTQEVISLLPHDYQKVEAEKSYIEWLDEQFSGIVWGCNEDKTEFWYYTCSDCGKIQTVTRAEVAGVGSSHKHEFAAILNGDGEAVAVKCAFCGETMCHEHDYAEKSTENGVIVYECKNCGETTQEYIEYTIRFVDWNETLISEAEYHYGDTVTAPADPTRSADNTYTYAFDGWNKPLSAVTADETYTATYIDYTIKFVDHDNTVISSLTYHYSDTVTIPSDPTRNADNTYTYSFNGWDKEVKAVSGNETYTATYKSTYIDYTVTFKNYDGSVIKTAKYHYGDTVTAPVDPTRAADNTYTYTFSGWDKELDSVTENTTYVATYMSMYIDYTIVFKDYDGTVLSEKTYHYGDEVTIPDDPEREEDETYTYSFSGWNKEITEVKGNETYTATFEATEKQQTQFVPGDINGDGSVNNKDVVALFKYVSGSEVAVNDIALDINGDGSVNNKDVVALFKYVSGAGSISDKPYDPNAKVMIMAIIPERIKVY